MSQGWQNFRELGSLNNGHNFRREKASFLCVLRADRNGESWDSWICSGFLAKLVHRSEGNMSPQRTGLYPITKTPSAWQRTTHPAVTFQQESPCMKSGVGSWRAWWSLGSWPMSLNFSPSRHTVGLDFPVPLEVRLGLATCFGQWYASNLAPWVSKMRRVCPTNPQWTCRVSKKETSIVLNCWDLSLYVTMAWDSIYWLIQRVKLHDKISRPWT